MSRGSSAVNLSKTAVENQPFTERGYVNVMDARLTGFGVRIGPATKTYFVYTRVKGRVNESGRYLEIRESIGRHGVIRFEDAKARAKQILEDAAIGITPEDRQKEKEIVRKAEKAKDITLEEAFEDYLAWNRQLKDSTKQNYRNHIDSYLQDWKAREVRGISPEDVSQRHALLSNKIAVPPAPPYQRKSRKTADAAEGPQPKKEKIRTNGPGVANATMKILRAVINYLRNHKGYTEANPVKLGKSWNKLKIRETIVTLDKLPKWYRAVQESEHPTVRDLLLFLLFTGTRSEAEAFKLKWSDIDWEGRIIYFYDTKNSTTLRLPMSNFIYDLLKKRAEAKPAKEADVSAGKQINPAHLEYVFPSPKAKEGHVTDIRDEVEKISQKAGFTISPHDLRRTFLTYADDNLGISFLTIKALVNHETNNKTSSGSADVTAGYIEVQMHQRREAIQRIEDYILEKAKVKVNKETEGEETLSDGSGI
jgi:integrase